MDNVVLKKKKEVEEFLNEIKKIDNKRFRFLPRLDNNKNPFAFISKIDYDLDDVIEEVKSLTSQDFLRCQIDTKNKFLLMYSFIKVIKNYIVYIKLSVVERENNYGYIISFHEAEKDELESRPYR